ncbi:hypothetical protein ACVI1L_006100 [Bradyrhizobium sp. USDA 4516]
MSELESLPLGEAIRLRWVLRDIRARRFIVSPLDRLSSESHQMGYVETMTCFPF